MPWIGVAFLVLGFVFLVHAFGLIERSKDVVAISRDSLAVVRDPNLDDEAKEVTLQRNAIKLLRLSLILVGGGAAAVFLPFGVVWLCSVLEIVSLKSVLALAFSPTVLIVAGVLAILMLFAGANRSGQDAGYSFMDRFLHRMAFRTVPAQIIMADMEDAVFARQLAGCKAERPVFVTALPRAGTTLLLECCSSLPDLAAHCYRDMPYVLIPCLWNRFASAFQRSAEKRPRFHGDGILIDLDSPEALEEVLWKAFWRRHYSSDRIEPWQDEEHPEFEEFFRNHMRKIISLRRGNKEPTARYVSKNNLNIARTRWLRQHFPHATIIVPFREPLQHAASLLKQHRNFLQLHQEDSFACEYMRAIGHFDFGRNLRPVDFDNWLDSRMSQDVEELAFWLEYWVAGYRHLVESEADLLHFLHFEALCEDPERGLRAIADAIATGHPEMLLLAATTIRRVEPHEVNVDKVPSSLLHEANDLYAALRQLALT